MPGREAWLRQTGDRDRRLQHRADAAVEISGLGSI
jgi:hypothetical protein